MVEVAPALLSDARATEIIMSAWGVSVESVQRLPSEPDADFLVDGRYVLKVSNPAEDPGAVEMENMAMSQVSQTCTNILVPSLIPTPAALTTVRVADDAGRTCLARLMTALPGDPARDHPVTAELAAQVGALAAQVSCALHGIFHGAGGRPVRSDVRDVPRVLAGSGSLDGPDDLAQSLREALPRLAASVAATKALPGGLDHTDVTLHSTLLSTDEPRRVVGLVDFGSLHHTAHVCDLAATTASVLRAATELKPDSTWELTSAALCGYQRHRALGHDEVEVLGDLMLCWLARELVLPRRRSHLGHTDPAPPRQHGASTRRALQELLQLGPDRVARRLHRLAGTARARPPRADVDRQAGHAGGAESGDLYSRRRRVSGGGLSPLFYTHPVHLVRGVGPWLIAADGTRYLDAYNNVAVVGHCHPTVVQSVSRQLATLNTHSRYLHEDIVELAERLLATMPAPIDTCIFTTSGTEANDLAWRMATAHTGGNGAIVAEHGYHGSSKWMADLSPNEWPPGYHPAHVATFAAPRASSGGLDHDTASDRIRAAAERLAEAGDRAALVLADLGFTSEGVLDAPDAFVAGLVDGAHAAGALFLADEVQSGFGRVGPAFWRFAAAGVSPDLVTLGKPMGAGYPIGALLTRRDIAESLARDYEYFSTFAASPAAAAAGLGVLDVLEDERIPERVVPVGEQLREGLRTLARRDPRLGAVRGIGLLAGVDLTGPPHLTDQADRRRFARALLDALRDNRVLAGLTGPDGTVLKVRPPLIWTTTHVETFISAVAASLSMVDA